MGYGGLKWDIMLILGNYQLSKVSVHHPQKQFYVDPEALKHPTQSQHLKGAMAVFAQVCS